MSILASPEYVNSGSRMTWTGSFGTFLFSKGPTDLIAAVSALLKNNYSLVVERSDNNIAYGGLGNGSITLYLRTDIDRGDGETDDGLSDIGGNVSNAFASQGFTVAGWGIDNYMPASSDGSTGSSPTIGTGTAQQTVAQQNANKTTNTISWWDKLTGELAVGSVGLLVGGVLVIGLLLYVGLRPQAT